MGFIECHGRSVPALPTGCPCSNRNRDNYCSARIRPKSPARCSPYGYCSMIPANDSRKVYLACGFTDMRKQINGLAALVQYQFELNPFSTALFVFCNRKHEKLKIQQWDQVGFWLHYRRLEKGKFQWPEKVTKPGAV